MSVQEAVASEPSDSSAEGVPRLFDEVVALVWFYGWEDYFCLSIVLAVFPLLIPGF